jgi:multiple sugar transport system substrate-binding protein
MRKAQHVKSTRFTLLAGAAATAILLAGCGGGTSVTANQAGTSAPDGKGDVKGDIQVSWWGGDSRNQKTNAVIDMFTGKNAGVTVDRQSADFAKYFDKLNVQAASKNLPCVVQLQGRQINDYTKRNVLLPLDGMVDSGAIDISDIPKAVVDAGRGTDGKLYFLPYGAAYDAVGVNTTLADQAGVGLPADGYNWSDFTQYLTTAQAKLPEGVTAANIGGGRPNYFIGWTQANGKTLFDKDGKLGFSKDDLKQYWTMWDDLRQKGVTISAQKSAEEPTAPDQSYLAHGESMTDTLPGNALTPATKTLTGAKPGQEMTTIPFPSGSKGSGNALYPSGFAISANCNNVPTAAAFVNFFTNDLEAGKSFASDNGAATNTKVLDAQLADPALSATKKHELELYKQIIAKNPPTIVFPAGYQSVFEDSFKRAYQEVSYGRMSIDQAVDKFFTEANAKLGQ